MGNSIDRITAAIDQLATDVQDRAGDPELTVRVADIWRMVSALDPELARRVRGYATPAGGTSSN